MKIAIGSNLLGESIFKDLSDFVSITVNIKGEENCSHFLLSLCNQLNIHYHPENCSERAPWKYMPYKENKVKGAIITLGNVQTSLGIFTVVISTSDINSIDCIFFYDINQAHLNCKDELQELVHNAITEMDNTKVYLFSVKLLCPLDNVSIEEYVGENFRLSTFQNHFLLEYKLQAIDHLEARELALQRLKYFLSFISLEANLLIEAQEIEPIEDSWTYTSNGEACSYYQDYIDNYPIDGNKLKLSYEGYKFINDYIFVKREESEDPIVKAIIAGSMHVEEGLEEENEMEASVLRVFPKIVVGVKPTRTKTQSEVTRSIMSYMSALEIATINEGKTDKCSQCGSDLYHISRRVKDIASKYIGNDIGKVFSNLYSFRSKYLHTGLFSTGRDFYHVRPTWDNSTATNLGDTGFMSMKSDGKSFLVYVMNVREWTSYILRCYYQEKLYKKTSFSKDFDSKDTIDSSVIPHITGYKWLVNGEIIPDAKIEAIFR